MHGNPRARINKCSPEKKQPKTTQTPYVAILAYYKGLFVPSAEVLASVNRGPSAALPLSPLPAGAPPAAPPGASRGPGPGPRRARLSRSSADPGPRRTDALDEDEARDDEDGVPVEFPRAAVPAQPLAVVEDPDEGEDDRQEADQQRRGQQRQEPTVVLHLSSPVRGSGHRQGGAGRRPGGVALGLGCGGTGRHRTGRDGTDAAGEGAGQHSTLLRAPPPCPLRASRRFQNSALEKNFLCQPVPCHGGSSTALRTAAKDGWSRVLCREAVVEAGEFTDPP